MNEKLSKIMQSIQASPKKVAVLPVDQTVLGEIFKAFKINQGSLLGTIVYHTGGIIVDDWIRIYGSGKANFYQRNQDAPCAYTLVAEDILGGLFAIMEAGTIGYFAPDTLQWEDNGLTYSEFLYWCIHGDTDTYYKETRWSSRKADVATLPIENGIAFYPFLWANAELEERTRQEVPLEEMIRLEFDFAKQFEDESPSCEQG